jgi:hypothetical protein
VRTPFLREIAAKTQVMDLDCEFLTEKIFHFFLFVVKHEVKNRSMDKKLILKRG